MLDILEQANMAKKLTFDAIVVDEGQDFSFNWWYTIAFGPLLSNNNSPLYVFMDPNQSLRGKIEEPDIEFDTHFKLMINCRNTKKIAETSSAILSSMQKFLKIILMV